MSQKSCWGPACQVTTKDGVTLHRFPNPETSTNKFNIWVSNIGGNIAELDADVVFRNRRVCDKHFEDIHKYPKNRLNSIAVPQLHLMSGLGALEKESTQTADLLLFFDGLFNSINGSCSQIRQGKIYRSAVTSCSPHHKLWNYSIPVLKSMKFINANNQGVVPYLSSWIKTIENFKCIVKYFYNPKMLTLYCCDTLIKMDLMDVPILCQQRQLLKEHIKHYSLIIFHLHIQ